MGVDAADFDGDGWQDLFVANVDQEMFSLYKNSHNESFRDVAFKNQVAQATRLLSGWGLRTNQKEIPLGSQYPLRLAGMGINGVRVDVAHHFGTMLPTEAFADAGIFGRLTSWGCNEHGGFKVIDGWYHEEANPLLTYLVTATTRQYPEFRQPVVERLIHSVARENAFFALATALPDVIPSLMELPWAFGEFASDTAFMTANQVRMAFLVAAACGREIGVSRQKAEILAIAAGAFGWRAIARELAGKIPFGGGLIPKGAIAYAATYAIGKGLERLYHAGAPYTRDEREEAYQIAFERGKSVAQEMAAGERAPGA